MHSTHLKRARLARRLKGAARRATLSFLALTMMVGIAGTNAGCFSQKIDVGAGASAPGAEEVELNQWFALWGLVPITQIDAQSAIGDAEDYTVHSVFTPIDVVINIFTSFVTIYRKSIIIQK